MGGADVPRHDNSKVDNEIQCNLNKHNLNHAVSWASMDDEALALHRSSLRSGNNIGRTDGPNAWVIVGKKSADYFNFVKSRACC